jgi:sporulation protein YlmC with PRC-barrel domain
MDAGVVMRLSDLLGVEVRTESGERLGHVHDLRGRLGSRSLEVTGLSIGARGMLERLGIGVSKHRFVGARGLVPWASVVSAGRRGIVVRDGTVPE